MRDCEDSEKVYLSDFAIADELQGQGLGYHFLVSVCKSIVDQGFKTMNLTVDVNNPAAINLYKDKLGFEIESLNKDEYGKGHDRYMMTLDLSKSAK